jgi:hypothetical protein
MKTIIDSFRRLFGGAGQSRSDSDIARGWINAALTLSDNPAAEVPCPACGAEFLTLVDAPFGPGTPAFERWLVCKSCNATSAIRRGGSG